MARIIRLLASNHTCNSFKV